MEITRDLLEHFLRATGQVMPAAVARALDAGLPVDLAVADLCDASRATKIGLAFRLGLCAAAEEALAEMFNWQPSEDDDEPDDGVEREVLRGLATRYLAAAGIEVPAWENALSKGGA